jgi:hypothetical protein
METFAKTRIVKIGTERLKLVSWRGLMFDAWIKIIKVVKRVCDPECSRKTIHCNNMEKCEELANTGD